jgi:hypothetical protein
MATPPLLDADTALTAVVGGVMGARRYPAGTALLFAAGTTGAALALGRLRPNAVGATPTWVHAAVDIAVAMAAWGAVRWLSQPAAAR